MADIALGDIHYNPANAAYEARVDIQRLGRTYRYPCSLPGELTMPAVDVRRGLTQQALRMARSEGGLLSIR